MCYYMLLLRFVICDMAFSCNAIFVLISTRAPISVQDTLSKANSI